MTEVIATTVTFVIILGILVFFHEFGHFSLAKLLGLKVEEFAFGFGPKLVRLFKRKETEYTVRAIPLGGFVRLPGMEPGDETTPDGFNSQPLWKRALVIFAGPFASFLLGYLVFIFMGVTVGFPKEDAKPQPIVGLVQPGTPADAVGLKSGDRILQISDKKIARGEQMLTIVHGSADKPLKLVIKRGSRTFTVTASPKPQPVLNAVNPAAARAGLKSGDRILAISGKEISDNDGQAVLNFARSNSDKPVEVEVSRLEPNGSEKTLTVEAPPQALRNLTGLLGFMPHIPTERTSFGKSIVYGTQMTKNYMTELVSTLTHRDKIKNVGGVVAIARVTEKTTESGFGALLLEVGMLSLGLAIINLVPWPVLDGGHLLFLLIEWVRGGRKLTVEQQAAITSLGLATLVFLAVLMFYVDISRWVSHTPLQ